MFRRQAFSGSFTYVANLQYEATFRTGTDNIMYECLALHGINFLTFFGVVLEMTLETIETTWEI